LAALNKFAPLWLKMLLFVKYLLVPVCAVLLTLQTIALVQPHAKVDYSLLIWVFSATIGGYHLTHPARWGRVIAYISALIALGIAGWHFDRWGSLTVVGGLSWGAYYGFRWPDNAAGWRSKPYAKPLLVAFVWSWTTVVLPAWAMLTPTHLKVALARAGFIWALAITYDYFDRVGDQAAGLRTLGGSSDWQHAWRLARNGLIISVLAWIAGWLSGELRTTTMFMGLATLGLCAAGLYRTLKYQPPTSLQKPLADLWMAVQSLGILMVEELLF
jgi:hypothetical protein